MAFGTCWELEYNGFEQVGVGGVRPFLFLNRVFKPRPAPLGPAGCWGPEYNRSKQHGRACSYVGAREGGCAR